MVQEKGQAKVRQPKANKARDAQKAPRVKKPKQEMVGAAYATSNSGKGAKVMANGNSCRVVHREFIGNVTGSATYAISNSFALNPGIAATFPWLAGIAVNWEAYRFHRVRLCYYTRTGSSTPGSVLLAHDPDSSDAAPGTEQIMSTYTSLREDAPWKDIMMPIRIQNLSDIGPRKFVRSGTLSSNQDIKLYDSGNLFIGTVDGTAVSWGKLWIEYDVEFFTPQAPPAGLLALAGGLITGSTALSAANPLGTAPVLDAQAAGISVNNASFITFVAAGSYLVTLSVTGTVITGISFVSGGAGTGALVAFTVNAAGTFATATFFANAASANVTATFTCTATTVTASNVSVALAPLNSLN